MGASGGTWGVTDGVGAAALAAGSPGRGIGGAAAAAQAMVSPGRGVGGRRKCLAPHVCGTEYPVGFTSSSASPHSCDRLRCTKCDFRVTLIPGAAWRGDVDYLFLRNNVPDVTRLRPMLRDDPACNAFCCQCTSMTCGAPQRVDPLATGWSCSGH